MCSRRSRRVNLWPTQPRCKRFAAPPHLPLPAVAGTAGTTQRRLLRALAALDTRGVCAQAAAAASTKATLADQRIKALKHSACPPHASRRAATDNASKVAAAAPGVAGWSSRQQLRRRSAPRVAFAASAGSDDLDLRRAVVAANPACPPAMRVAATARVASHGRRIVAGSQPDPPLQALLFTDPDVSVRDRVAASDCPVHLLKGLRLIYDGAHSWVRIFWRWPRTRHKVRGTGFARPTV